MNTPGPKQPFRIRRLGAADFRALLNYDWDPLVPERDTIYLYLTQDHASMSLVAEDDEGEALGYVVAARSADGRAAFVFHLHVRKGLRRQGLGRALMERLEERAREAGVDRVWLLAGGRARSFYVHIGYAQAGGLLHPEAEQHVRSVKRASVLVKNITRQDGPKPPPAKVRGAEKRAKGG